MTICFFLEGLEFVAVNGGPYFTFSPAVSFVVTCKSPEEIDFNWEKLSADPAGEQGGGLRGKFGLSWQIVPEVLAELLSARHPDRFSQVMQAVLGMKKLDSSCR